MEWPEPTIYWHRRPVERVGYFGGTGRGLWVASLMSTFLGGSGGAGGCTWVLRTTSFRGDGGGSGGSGWSGAAGWLTGGLPVLPALVD